MVYIYESYEAAHFEW